MTERFGGPELRRAALASLDALRAHQAEIDRANVYPVPDGDTGTNLVLTMESVAEALEALSSEEPSEVAAAIARAALMGARGNSGVILAQYLRGLVEASGRGPEAVARALGRAADLAYEAVLHPVEGTILTVARAGAKGARGRDLVAVFDGAARAAREALARTPEQLPILGAAGVVDAGGMGLCVVLESFRDALAGRISPRGIRAHAEAPEYGPIVRMREMGDPAYAYEVQYLLEAPEHAVPALRERLGEIGDSVAVIGGDGTWRVHVHTNQVGRAVELGVDAGRPSRIEVVAFRDQIAAAARQEGVPALVGGAQLGIPLARAATRTSLVAVGSGEGAMRLFREVGCDAVVDGGATMNPSVSDLLAAIEAAPGDDVILLANDADVVAAARTAAGEAAKRVEVVETADMAAGLAAALAYGDARPFEENIAEIRRALARTRTGRVAIADRSRITPAGPVEAGQALGFASGELVAICAQPLPACLEVCDRLAAAEAGAITVLCGERVDEPERDRVHIELAAHFPRATVEVLDGGQPVYRYLIAIE